MLTDLAASQLEIARDRLLFDGSSAMRFGVVSVGMPMLKAGEAINELIVLFMESPFAPTAHREAALHALGEMERVFTRLERIREPEAYQVLLMLSRS